MLCVPYYLIPLVTTRIKRFAVKETFGRGEGRIIASVVCTGRTTDESIAAAMESCYQNDPMKTCDAAKILLLVVRSKYKRDKWHQYDTILDCYCHA